jgi:hypothetical protein
MRRRRLRRIRARGFGIPCVCASPTDQSIAWLQDLSCSPEFWCEDHGRGRTSACTNGSLWVWLDGPWLIFAQWVQSRAGRSLPRRTWTWCCWAVKITILSRFGGNMTKVCCWVDRLYACEDKLAMLLCGRWPSANLSLLKRSFHNLLQYWFLRKINIVLDLTIGALKYKPMLASYLQFSAIYSRPYPAVLKN